MFLSISTDSQQRYLRCGYELHRAQFTADDAHSEGLNWGGVNLRHALPPGEAHGGQVKRSSWGFGASWRQHIVSARSLVKLAVAMNPV